jgi:alpha-1,2-mannosyltransferase
MQSWRSRFVVWSLAAAAATLYLLPPVARQYRTNERRDFEVEWLSARNYFRGVAVYEQRAVSIRRHAADGPVGGPSNGDVNPHPPTSILLGLPFARLRYPDAFAAWNLASLAALLASIAVLMRGRQIPWDAPRLLRVYALILTCGPMNANVYQGQLNAFLLLLLVGVWAADRTRRRSLAGMLLGAATVIKLFPGLLIVHFALLRRWRTVATTLATIVGLTAITAAVLGFDAYGDFLRGGVTTPWQWRSAWWNLSILAFWSKLFDPVPQVGVRPGIGGVAPLVQSAAIARVGFAASVATLLALLVSCTLKARAASEHEEIALSLWVVAGLLMSPVLWPHYLVILLLPVFVLWTTLPRTGLARWDLRVLVAILWLSPETWYFVFVLSFAHAYGQSTASPSTTLTALSITTYATVGLFVLGCVVILRAYPSGVKSNTVARSSS